jgi:hypothetical protein
MPPEHEVEPAAVVAAVCHDAPIHSDVNATIAP